MVGGEDRFLILHNDGAVNFTLVEAPVADPTDQRTLIAGRDDVRLDAVDAFAGHLLVSYRSEALPRIQLWPITANGQYGTAENIEFDSELMSSGLAGNPNWDAPRLRIAATSFVTPVRIYDLESWPPASGSCCVSSRCSVTTGPRNMWSTGTGRSPTTGLGFRYR